jgi:predicted nucleic acid-binding protein
MRVAFDTNVLLDSILSRPERESALSLMKEVADETITGVVTANSITDLYYVSRKGIGDAAAREAIYCILSLFDIAPVDSDICYSALSSEMSDFEDAVLAACAEKCDADYIATRDEGFIRAEGCPVPAMRPDDIIKIIHGEK